MSHRNIFSVVAVLAALGFATSAHAAVTIIMETYDTDVASFPAGDASYSAWSFNTNNGSTAAVTSGELITSVSNSPIGVATTTHSVASLTDVTVKAQVITTDGNGNSETGLIVGNVGWGVYDGFTLNRLRDADDGTYFGFDGGVLPSVLVDGRTYNMEARLQKTGAASWDLTLNMSNVAGDPAFAFSNTTALTDAQATGGLGVIDRVGTWTYGILGAATHDNFMAIDNLAVEVIPAPAALPAGLAMIGLLATRRRRK